MTDATESERLLGALAQVDPRADDGALLTQLLEYAALPQSKVKLQDMGSLVTRIGSRGGLAFKLTWDFIFNRTDDMLARFGAGGSTAASYNLGRPLLDLAQQFTNVNRMAELQGWASRYQDMLDSNFMQIVTASIERNRRWLVGPAGQLCKWLQNNYGN